GFERDFRSAMGPNFTDKIAANKSVSTGDIVVGPRVQTVSGGRATFFVVVDQLLPPRGASRSPNSCIPACWSPYRRRTTRSRPCRCCRTAALGVLARPFGLDLLLFVLLDLGQVGRALHGLRRLFGAEDPQHHRRGLTLHPRGRAEVEVDLLGDRRQEDLVETESLAVD